jgi:hypothetical protein
MEQKKKLQLYAGTDGYSSKYVVVLQHCLSPEDDYSWPDG